MTPDERARRLVDDHGLTRAPGDALKAYIAAEIASAVYAEREACAKIVEREVWIRSGGVAARNVAKAVRLGRTDVSDESMKGFTSTE